MLVNFTEKKEKEKEKKDKYCPRINRLYVSGTASISKSIGQEREAEERVFPTLNPSHASSARPTHSAERHQNQMRNSSRRNDVETKADAWERAEMERIKKR